jgi:hypothetical protein
MELNSTAILLAFGSYTVEVPPVLFGVFRDVLHCLQENTVVIETNCVFFDVRTAFLNVV